MKLLWRIWLWIRSLFETRYQTKVVRGDLPKILAGRTIYLVEEDGYREQAAMLCPCGCGHVIQLNLLVDERPCWSATTHDDGTVSLHPSVWGRKGCKSHFWFRRGRVNWVPRLETEN